MEQQYLIRVTLVLIRFRVVHVMALWPLLGVHAGRTNVVFKASQARYAPRKGSREQGRRDLCWKSKLLAEHVMVHGPADAAPGVIVSSLLKQLDLSVRTLILTRKL